MKNIDLKDLYKKLIEEDNNIANIIFNKMEGGKLSSSCYAFYLEKVFNISQDYHEHNEFEILYVLPILT